MDEAEYVIECATENLRQRLVAYDARDLVYAVALFNFDPDSLWASGVVLGRERDRVELLESYDREEAFWRVWNAYEFGLDGVPTEPDLSADPEYAEAERKACEQLGGFATRHVLNRVAARVSLEHPLRSVTQDFVVFAFDEDFGEDLLSNIGFSAPAQALALLGRKGLV